jgi:hypothetical protein
MLVDIAHDRLQLRLAAVGKIVDGTKPPFHRYCLDFPHPIIAPARNDSGSQVSFVQLLGLVSLSLRRLLQIEFDHLVVFAQLPKLFWHRVRAEGLIVNVEAQHLNSFPGRGFGRVLFHCANYEGAHFSFTGWPNFSPSINPN